MGTSFWLTDFGREDYRARAPVKNTVPATATVPPVASNVSAVPYSCDVLLKATRALCACLRMPEKAYTRFRGKSEDKFGEQQHYRQETVGLGDQHYPLWIF